MKRLSGAARAALLSSLMVVSLSGVADAAQLTGGKLYHVSQNEASEVPLSAASLTPSSLVLINGLLTPSDDALDQARALATARDAPVFLLYNATNGFVADAFEYIQDELFCASAPARAARALLTSAIEQGAPLHVVAISQGATIAASAGRALTADLLEAGHTRASAEAMLGGIFVETMGGATKVYPHGFRYLHHLNDGDYVAGAFGLAESELTAGRDHEIPVEPGRGAVICHHDLEPAQGESGLLDSLASPFRRHDPIRYITGVGASGTCEGRPEQR